jgi:hypothetical protein
MKSQRPYRHILKNLFHEQATEIIPLLLPEYRVDDTLPVEIPELKITPIDRPVNEFDEAIVNLALPGAQLKGMSSAELIEHTGNFELAYRTHHVDTGDPKYMVIEFQTEREVENLPRRLQCNFTEMLLQYAHEEIHQGHDPDTNRGTIMISGRYLYPAVLCPFPSAVPAPIRDMIGGEVISTFNFKVIGLWEKDAREILNTHISAGYFLLPAMKNVDASLLRMAIEELAKQFEHDEIELGRHLTGMNLMLQQSEIMSEEEKLAAQKHLEPFTHLIKSDPYDE